MNLFILSSKKRDKKSSKKSDKKSFSKVILVAGSVDCSQTESTTDSILNDMVDTVDKAKGISSSVVISSITPRTDDGMAQLKAENVKMNLDPDKDSRPAFILKRILDLSQSSIYKTSSL